MDIELYDKLMEQGPTQHPPEWWTFLEICEMYLKKHEIENPTVVELGIGRNKQKKFYEQLLRAEHIGIDYHSYSGIPDIRANTHEPKTLEMLKKKLGGKPINILFIDACHCYADVRRDFEMYSPLCGDIVAFHDIELGRYENNRRRMVWKFWDELKMKIYKGEEGYRNFMVLSIHQHKGAEGRQMGIGAIIKNG